MRHGPAFASIQLLGLKAGIQEGQPARQQAPEATIKLEALSPMGAGVAATPNRNRHHCGDQGRSQLAEKPGKRFERAGAQVLDLPALVIWPPNEWAPDDALGETRRLPLA